MSKMNDNIHNNVQEDTFNELKKYLVSQKPEELIRLSIDGKAMVLKQIAHIALKGNTYYILKPVSKVKDFSKDDCMILYFKDYRLQILNDIEKIDEVVEEYYSVLNQNEPKYKKTIIKNKEIICLKTAKSEKLYKINKLKDRLNKLDRYEEHLSIIVGQGNNVTQVCEYLYANLDKEVSKGPRASIVMVGPPGTGKTTMAELIAETLGLPRLLLSMSSFSDKEANFSFAGSNHVYKDSKPGIFTQFVEDNHNCVVIFDEIEKAHKNTLRLFLGALDKGFVKDLYTEHDVDLSGCIMIFTSNVGRNIYDKDLNKYNYATISRKVLIDEMTKEINPVDQTPFLSPALVSRFSESPILLFNRLSPLSAKKIIAKEIESKIKDYEEKRHIKIQINANNLANNLIYEEGDTNNIRSLKGRVTEFFNNQFINIDRDFTKKYPYDAYDVVTADFTFDRASEEVKKYVHHCVDGKKYNVLVVTDDPKSKLYRLNNNQINYIYKSSDFDFFNTTKLDLNAIILDISKNNNKVMKAFDCLIEREYSIPIYIYTSKKLTKSNFSYYINKGCEDYYSPMISEISFSYWINNMIDGLKLTATLNKLKSRCKSLKYDYEFDFNENTKTIKISFDAVSVITSISSKDNQFFVPMSDIESVSFDDIVGGKTANKILNDCVDYLVNYKDYRNHNISIPKGAILFGSPGIGKTLRAKAIAKECGLPFISLSSVDFVRGHVGEGPQLIKDVFSSLRKYGGILFIDEFELLAGNRENGVRSDYHEITNTLLSEMDGFSSNAKQPIFVIAATNFDASLHSQVLDKAVLRRFDYKIKLENPTRDERLTYINKMIKSKELTGISDKAISNIATRTIGWNFSDISKVLENMKKESYKRLRQNETVDVDQLLNDVFENFVDGDVKIYSTEEIKNVSYHEAGHAFVSYYLGNTPDYVTINARGNYGGYVYHNFEDKFSFTKDEILDEICATLSGRAAEEIVFHAKGITTGASSDLRQASNLALKMYNEFGMCSDNLLSLPNTELGKVEKEMMNNILKQEYARALEIINNHYDDYLKVVSILIQKNYLIKDDFLELGIMNLKDENKNGRCE